MADGLKHLAIEAQHVAAGAKMVPFGGWNMPVQYAGILAEHEQTRTGVSLFDCSHMGQFRVRGPKAGADLDALLPRPVSDMEVGSCRYNFLLNERGGVIDDLIVYCMGPEHFYIVVNAATCAGDAQWMRRRVSSTTKFVDESEDTAKFDIQGPQAWGYLEKLGVGRGEVPRYYRFSRVTVNGVPTLLSRTGYTGEAGVELYFDVKQAGRQWDYLLGLGGIAPAGLGARDTLRLEMGYPLYGHEMDESTTPVEAGFGKLVDLGHVFTGRNGLLGPPQKVLVGLRFEGRRAAREGTAVCGADGEVVGTVTSGSLAPSLGCAIAMAYVRPGVLAPGSVVRAQVGRSELVGQVVEMPFYKKGSARAK